MVNDNPSKPKVVALVPARGGSKGLPRKNIALLAGKPLIAYTIEAARQSSLVDRVLVTTDDEEIRQVALACGAEAPFLRPAELAQDNTPTEPVLSHAVAWLRDNEGYLADIVVFLQLTDVFRKAGMIDAVVQRLLDDPSLDSAFMACETHKNYWRQQGDGYVKLAADIPYGPRQSRECLYREDTGMACATRAEFILAGRRLGDKVSIVGYHEELPFVDIHSRIDLWLAEKLISELGVKVNG